MTTHYFDTDSVNPQMVTLARLSRGLKQQEVARRIGTGQGTISKLEAGIATVSEEDLEALSIALGYPRRFFFIRTRIDGGSVMELYHNRKRKMTKAMAIYKAYANATIRRLHIERLLEASDYDYDTPFPYYPVEELGDPVQIARTVRAAFELPPGPVFDITAAIERAGGIVVECDFTSRQIDGFSRWRQHELPPLFFMNSAAPPDRDRWTKAHELGHIVMHTNAQPYDEMENEANMFASEFLTPAQLIKPQLVNLTLSRLAALKTYWKVSMQALVYRAGELMVISPRQRTYLFTQLSKAGYRLREPSDLDPPQEQPKILFDLVQMHLKHLGYTVSDLAEALALTEFEFRSLYLPDSLGLELHK